MKRMQGDEPGYWIVLAPGLWRREKKAHSMRTQWTAHRVDKSVGPIFEELKKHEYRLHVTLIGKANNVIAGKMSERLKTNLKLKHRAFYRPCVIRKMTMATSTLIVLAPFFWKKSVYEAHTV